MMSLTEVMESWLLFQNIFISRRSEVANFADVIKILLINKPAKLEVLESEKKVKKLKVLEKMYQNLICVWISRYNKNF